MKARISFTIDDLTIEVPDGTDMDVYVKENAWELVKQIIDEPASILPDTWEEED